MREKGGGRGREGERREEEGREEGEKGANRAKNERHMRGYDSADRETRSGVYESIRAASRKGEKSAHARGQ